MGKVNKHVACYWTDERVIEESHKYQTKGEFKRLSPTAYKIACQKGFIASMAWLKDGRQKKRGPRKNLKYTKEVIGEIIKKHSYKTTTDLRLANEYAYKIARDNDWLTELGLIENKHEDGYWSEDKVWAVAKQYTSKNDFCKYEPVAYKWAGRYGILDKMSWMKSPTYNERRENRDSEVYAYIDEENKVVYVGLTIDSQNRKRSHKYQKNSAVRKHFGKNIPEPLILLSQLTIDESTYWEEYYKNKFIHEGYRILNIAPTGLGTGSIGGISKWSSREVVFEKSHKYHSRSEFKRKAGGWTKSRVFEESHKYTNKKDFEANAKTAFIIATQKGWIKQMTWLQPLPLGHISEWTRENIIKESKKYTSKTEFAIKSPTAYKHALEDKSLFLEMTWLIEKKKPNGWWEDKSRVMEEGKKYRTRTAFANGSYSAWKAAKRNGWIEEMTWFKKQTEK